MKSGSSVFEGCTSSGERWGTSTGNDSGYFWEDVAGEEGLIEDRNYTWLYWCQGLPLERWQEECRLVEERFSLFQSFAEAAFFRFRAVVSPCANIA